MKLSLAHLASTAAIAMALPQVPGGGGAGGNAPAMPGGQPGAESGAQQEGSSAGESTGAGEQGQLRPGYSSLLDALGIDKLLLNPVADAIGSLTPTPSPSASASPAASSSAAASAPPSEES